jgi:BASS family bile acid:Na+ symporter
MDGRHGRLAAASHFLHRRFLWLLVGAYLLAAVAPAAGDRVRGAAVELPGGDSRLPVPMLMLAGLLFAAGLGVRGDHLRGVLRRPAALALGLAANLAVPVLFALAAAAGLELWHDPEEAEALVVGLAVVAAMPVAGSSAGWARAADGDMALSLGLVLLSTLLSPLTTPVALAAVGLAAPDGAGGELGRLAAGGGVGWFLACGVAAPTALGVLVRAAVGGPRVDAAGPALKLATSAVLLVLCYANAAACLPAVAADPDWDFLALILAAVMGMCGAGFAAGFAVARAVGAGPAQRAALVFGLGMANNGTGLVLASVALAAHPLAVLPVVGFNLVQHLAAGAAAAVLGRPKWAARRGE